MVAAEITVAQSISGSAMDAAATVQHISGLTNGSTRGTDRMQKPGLGTAGTGHRLTTRRGWSATPGSNARGCGSGDPTRRPAYDLVRCRRRQSAAARAAGGSAVAGIAARVIVVTALPRIGPDRLKIAESGCRGGQEERGENSPRDIHTDRATHRHCCSTKSHAATRRPERPPDEAK